MRQCGLCERPISRQERLCDECAQELGIAVIAPKALAETVQQAEAVEPDRDARRKELIRECGFASERVHQEMMASEQRYLGRGARKY